ncbi:hypothetical protein OC842_001253 [Tilletia horrida]|uniref:Uncharacterized protein n=1 Tax=Tilletia horrida TaxID=155126 RepID=A0AAN6JTC8_9BASI|nr:hypothetical protein OC842_001253 [Tilletia horrida]
MPDGTNLPPMPPLPASAVSERRSNSIPTINTSSAASDTLAPLPSKSRGLRPPPIPGTAKRQVLSYEEAEAQEEEELSALQREEDLKGGPTANKRLSAMGPKLKKNSLAPWELGADDDTEPSGSMGSSFNPFAKRPSTDIRERDSADIRRAGGAAPATPAKDAVSTGSSSLASNFFGRPSRDYASSQKHDASGVAMESEFTDSTTNSSGFRTSFGDASSSTTAPGPNGANSQSARSRTKSISSAAAAGVLKGLGLGPTAGGVGPGGHAPSVPMGMPITANGGPVGSVSTRGASISGGEVSMPGSAPSSMGKKSKLAKALRLGNSMSAAGGGGGGGSGVQTNHHAPVGMYPSHPRESGSGLSHDDSAIVSPTRPISNTSHPHGSSSHQAPSLSTQQQQQQGGRTSMSAPHSPVSYSPRGASPPLPPLMSLSQSAIRQNSSATTGGGGGGIGGSSGDDTVLMSPTSLSASGGQRSSSSTTAHTSSSLGGGGSGGGGGGLKALKLQPRVPASAAGGPAAIAWLHRGSTGDGFGGAGGPLTPHLGQAAGASASGPAADGEDGDWRKPVLLSPRTTSLGVGPPLPGGGVSMSMSTSSSSGSSLTSPSRTRMPTSPTATRLGSVGASASASSAGPRATDSLSLPLSSLPSGGVTQSDSVLTITDPRGGLGGPERYASPPPVGAGPQGHGLPGTAAAGALGLTASSSGGDQTEANANTSNDSVGTNANGQLPSAQSFPRPGQAEGVAYRLISLEEARANQAREREERNARSGRGKAVGVGGGGGGAAGPGASQMGPRPGSSGGVMASSSSSGAVSRSYSASNGMGPGGIPGLPSSSSQGHASGPQDEHHDQLHAHRNSNGPATGISSGSGGGSGAGSGSGSSGGKGLKNKKSGGFLRMFNKDRSGDHAPPMPGMSNNRTGSVEEGRNTFSEDHEAGRGSVGRGSASTASGAPPPPKFTVSSDASGGRGGGGGALGGGPPTLGGLSVASAPALKLRPMSSMLSGFSADLLDPTLTETGLSSAVASASSATAAANANANTNSAASASGGAAGPGGAASATSTSSLAPGGGGAAALTSPTASKSPTLLSPVEGNLHLANSRSTSMTSLSSGALGEDSKLGGAGGRTARAAVGVGASVDSEAGVRKASLSTAGASAGGVRTDKVLVGGIGKPVSAAVSRQASEHSDGVSAGQQQQQQQQQQQSQGLVASAGLASPTTSDTGGSFANTSTGSGNGNGKLPAWKARALELEAKIVEYAAELAELRNTYFTQAAAEAAAEDEENGGGGAGTADGLSSFPESGGTGTLTPVRGAAGGNKELATPTPGSVSASSQDGAGGSTSTGTGTGTGTGGTIIPPCALCGCACAEQRRQQALNAAAVLKGISVLDRGRAIKPGLIQSSRFGSYALRS